MLTAEQIEANKARFLGLISEIDIPGADLAGLTEFLETSDFFTAPASTQFHSNYEGGLCQHSLNVYDNLLKLVDMHKGLIPEYEKSSLIVVALLHDMAKINFYEKFVVNKKIYDPRGTKHDNMGNFDWFAEDAYRVKDAKDRFIAGEHGENSMFLAGKYIPLTFEETLAILHHHMGMGESRQLYDLSAIANKYPLVTLLHSADLLATYVSERI